MEQACQQFKFVYLDGVDAYIEPDYLLEELNEIIRNNPEAPFPYIWGTYTTELTLPSASDLVDEACEDLHDEAPANISQADIDCLQELLDQWTAKVKGGTTTYWPDYRKAIILDEIILREINDIVEMEF